MTESRKNSSPIQISRFAECSSELGLIVKSGKRPIQMVNSDATGGPLVACDGFGADVIRFGPAETVANHTHVGAHILFVIKGSGWVEYEGTNHELEAGMCYLIPSMANHAIKAKDELVLIAVGNDHREVGCAERLELVSTQEACW